MITKEQIEQFYEDVEKLGLVTPVASIAEATGWLKGNVSQYLSGKLRPSENFLNAFYSAFPKNVKNVPYETFREQEEVHSRNKEDLIFDELSKIRQSNDKLIDQQGILVETNKKLADKLLSINSDDQKEMIRGAILESLVDLIARVGVDAGTWKDHDKAIEAAGKMLSGKIRESNKMNKNGV